MLSRKLEKQPRCLPAGKADDTASPAFPGVRGSSLQLHPWTPWIRSTLDLCNVRVNVVLVLTALLISGAVLYGCFSFRFFKGTEGREIVLPGDTLQVGKTTLHEALSLLGAPDQVVELKGKDLLVYERAVLRQNRVSLGIPVADVWGASADLSAYGNLARYDTLALFFTPDGVLRDMAFEKGSVQPYLKTLFAE